MTGLVAALDIISVVGAGVALCVVWRGKAQLFDRESRGLIALLLVLVLVHNLGNTLSALGITGRLELYEDQLLVIVFGIWAIALYSLYRWLSERRLKASEERLRLTLFGTGAGLWDWNVQSDELVINEQWAEMIGYTLEELEPVTIETWNALVHPEDLKRVDRKLEEHFRGEADNYECEARMKHKGEDWIWVLDKGKVVEWDEEGEPLRMTGTHQEITELKEAQLSLERQKERLEVLRHVGLNLTSELDIDELLEHIVAHAVELVDGSKGGVYMLDHDRDALDLHIHTGFESLPENTALGLGEGLIGKVWKRKETISVDDYLAWGGHAPVWGEHVGHRAVIGVPVVWRDELYGVLEILRDGGLPFFDEHKNLLQQFAVQAAVALRNAQLFEQAQQRMHRLNSLREVDRSISASLDINITLNLLLSSLLKNLEVDAGDILLYHPSTGSLEYAAGKGFRSDALQQEAVRVGEGQAGKAALTREVVHIPDLRLETVSRDRAKHIRNEGFESYVGVPLIAKGEIVGVLEAFHRSPLGPTPEWLDFLETLAGQAAIAIDHLDMFHELKRSNLNLERAYNEVIEGWARALELRDQETEGHSRRVEQLTLTIAKKMGVKGEALAHIRQGSLLHDIGKMGVPDRILQKPGKLTDEEWEIMKMHPTFAYQMLLPIDHLKPALDIPHYHHEKWDGSGYPKGLQGEEIPLAARIFAVVDVWDALRSDRPYRDAWSDEKALHYIKDQSGEQFDPEVVEVFLDILARGDLPEA